MQSGDLRHEAIMALIDLQGGFSALENDLTAESASAENIINAIDYFIEDLQETKKCLRDLRKMRVRLPRSLKPR
jgi:hypothetical protein